MQIEILVEEPSMKVFLSAVLPKILPEGFGLNINCFVRPHQGKNDLKKSIPKKVRALSHYQIESKVVILIDQDSSDCKTLKSEIVDLCQSAGNCPALVRIVCRELEAWYLGDMQAIGLAFPAFNPARHQGKQKFRNPDACNAADELRKIIPGFGKMAAARTIPEHMTLESNRSQSFNQFLTGLIAFLNS